VLLVEFLCMSAPMAMIQAFLDRRLLRPLLRGLPQAPENLVSELVLGDRRRFVFEVLSNALTGFQ